MGFFNKKPSAREKYSEKFSKEISSAYDESMKKKLVADAHNQALRDGMTKKEKFGEVLTKVKTAKKKFKKFKDSRAKSQPLEVRSRPFEP